MGEYYFSRTLQLPFAEAVERTKTALAAEGFGILTDIDVQQVMQKKLGVGFRCYRILGACNPFFAHQALQVEDKIGTMLPCNVIVQERESGGCEIAAVDPIASMSAVQNEQLQGVAREVRRKLRKVVDSL